MSQDILYFFRTHGQKFGFQHRLNRRPAWVLQMEWQTALVLFHDHPQEVLELCQIIFELTPCEWLLFGCEK